jgi:membrane protease YdiL (CAAX protease family)
VQSKPTSNNRALLALILLVPAPTIGVAAAMLVPATAGTPLGQGIYAAAKVWLIVLPAVWWLFVDKGKPSWSPPRKGGFGVGILLGLAISAAIFGAYALFGRQFIDAANVRAAAEQSGIAEPWRYISLAAYLCTINALLEEYVWRWFVFRKCEALVKAGWVAVALSAMLFTVHHVLALAAQFDWLMTTVASIGVFIGGAVWSWCYLKYRSIWPGFVSHVIVDIAIFVIGWQLIFM